ncbi:MAG: hypothetical protein KDA80_05910 [Planctomycetaceae bacterium]|nr:hypothetical protein [Planctomycetaceae bacterium]
MKRSHRIVLAALCLMAMSPLAEAQRPGGGRGPGFGRGQINIAVLVGLEQVQKEIGAEGDTLAKLNEASEKHRNQMGEVFEAVSNFRNMSEEERESTREKMQEKMTALNKEAEAAVREAVSESQWTRLQQISWQSLGARALRENEVAKALTLTEEQQTQIESAFEDAEAARREMFSSRRPGGNFREAAEKMQELQSKTEENVMAILTADQKTQWSELTGEKFELDRSALFRGSNGRGGDRGNNNGEGRGPQRRPPM